MTMKPTAKYSYRATAMIFFHITQDGKWPMKQECRVVRRCITVHIFVTLHETVRGSLWSTRCCHVGIRYNRKL